VHHQLDSLAGMEVLQGQLLLQGSSNRLQGGAVILMQRASTAAVGSRFG
jgi:hypothetical protein